MDRKRIIFFFLGKNKKKGPGYLVQNQVAFAPRKMEEKWGLAPFFSSHYWRGCSACSEQSEGIFFAPRNALSAFLTVFSLCSVRQAFLLGRSSFFSLFYVPEKVACPPFF